MYTNTTHPWEGLGNISRDPLFAQPGYWESDPNDSDTDDDADGDGVNDDDQGDDDDDDD